MNAGNDLKSMFQLSTKFSDKIENGGAIIVDVVIVIHKARMKIKYWLSKITCLQL